MGKLKFIILFFTGVLLLTTGCVPIGNTSHSSTPAETSDTASTTDVETSDTATTTSAATSEIQDTMKPKLRLPASEQIIVINQGDNFDLLSGITGSDETDGDITKSIQLNKGDYAPNIPGKYIVVYFLSDAAGNAADPVMRTIIVKDTKIFTAPVFSGTINGEILNPKAPALFGGAWYHKVVSSKDQWIGIEGTITLPEVKIRRYDGAYNTALDIDPAFKNLDNPSVYVGGNAKTESDVGLSFSRALIDVNTQKLSSGSIAFRPFWRYITSENQDVGGYDVHDGEYAVSANGNNCIANYHWRYTEYYYLPGDKLRILIHIPEPNKMQLQIEVIEKSTLPSSIEMREKYGWKDPDDFKSPIFHSPGHGTGIKAEYKRVNAIDQVANEGKTAIASQTEVMGAIWHNTYLYREIDGKIYRVPMNESRRGVLSAPDNTKYTITFDGVDPDIGGEVITIHPGYSN